MNISRILLLVALCIAFVAVVSQRMQVGRGSALIGEQASSGVAALGGEITLTNHLGEQFSTASLGEQYRLVYFGYTFCPDICPAGLMVMSQALEDAGEELANRITPIFITLDPERDTVDVMQQYVENFHDRLIGLTGTTEQVRAAADAYKVYYALHKETPEQDDYLVDHSGYIYLINPQGEYVKHFSHETDVTAMVSALKEYIK